MVAPRGRADSALAAETRRGLGGGQAFAEMKKYGFGADWLHPEFKKFVLAYVPPAPAPIPQVLDALKDKIADAAAAVAQ